MMLTLIILAWLLSGFAGAGVWFFCVRVFQYDESMSLCTVALNGILGPVSLVLGLYIAFLDFFLYHYKGCGKAIFKKEVK
jgi:hypothetical protein